MKHLFGKIFYDISTTLWKPSLAIWIYNLKITLSVYPFGTGAWKIYWHIEDGLEIDHGWDTDENLEANDIIKTELFMIFGCPFYRLQIYYLEAEKIDGQ